MMKKRVLVLLAILAVVLFAAAVLAQDAPSPPSGRSDAFWQNAFGFGGAVVLALVTIISLMINTRSNRTEAAAVRKELAAGRAEAAESNKKIASIEHQTNSANSNLQRALDLAEAREKGLAALLTQAYKAQADAETAHALADLKAAYATPVVAPAPAVEVLASIEKNTADTATNTAPAKGE